MTDPPGPPRQPQIEHNPATDSAQFDQRKGLFAEGGTFNGQVIGYQENNVTQVLPALPTPNTLTPRQRAELLDRLVLRYRERLDNALAHKVRLQLGLHTRPDAVDPAWRRLHLRGLVISKVVPPGTPVVELFDGQQEQLLVLGAPGAGKTTLIVELAQALAARAQLNLQVRLPVVLNIAAWHSGQTLREWLQRALRDVLGVSRRFAAQLAGSDDLLLLLDGLDEVAADHRATCVAAIIAYLDERDLAPPLVVGCRSREYADLNIRLPIAGAIELEPLSLAEIEKAIVDVPAAQGVLVALQTDEILRDLATTPLMINILLLTYSDKDIPILEGQTTNERLNALWNSYIRRMLQQRPFKDKWNWEVKDVLCWIVWLAYVLRSHDQTDLLIDELQPNMLPSNFYENLYRYLVWTVRGSIGGLMGLSIAGLIFYFIFGAFPGILGGVIFGVMGIFRGVMGVVLKTIYRVEQLTWSWSDALQLEMRDWQIVLGGGLTSAFSGFLVGGLETGILSMIIGSISGIFIRRFSYGWNVKSLRVSTLPMQSIHSSFRASIFRMLFVGSMVIVAMTLGVVLIGVNQNGLGIGLICGVTSGILGGLFRPLVGGLGGGFSMLIKHYLLRLILFRAGLFPFRAVTFLEAMTERLLLERDGALYRFRHLLLRDFIADLSNEEIDELARGL